LQTSGVSIEGAGTDVVSDSGAIVDDTCVAGADVPDSALTVMSEFAALRNATAANTCAGNPTALLGDAVNDVGNGDGLPCGVASSVWWQSSWLAFIVLSDGLQCGVASSVWCGVVSVVAELMVSIHRAQ
jgi:hypothetical protein